MYLPHINKNTKTLLKIVCILPPKKQVQPIYTSKPIPCFKAPFKKTTKGRDISTTSTKKNAPKREPESSRLKAAQTLHDLPPTRLKRRCTLAVHGGLVATTLKTGKTAGFQPYISRF